MYRRERGHFLDSILKDKNPSTSGRARFMGESPKHVAHQNYALKKFHRSLEDVLCVGSKMERLDAKSSNLKITRYCQEFISYIEGI